MIISYTCPIHFSLYFFFPQRPSGHGPSPGCRYWSTECWKVFSHRGHLWDYLASVIWNLYTVRFGLSSVITSIDVNLRSCPTECRLSRSQAPWQCIVSLRFNYQGQVRNEVFGPVIYDKGQVEDRIRRAQRAILNPTKPSKQFLGDTEEIQESELSFSSSCVSLQISGPDVADLSFCDLPGAFFFCFLFYYLLPFYKASFPT